MPSINDLTVCGMHVDLRAQVMTLSALKDLVLEHEQAGMNALVMEWEAAFPFERHATISNGLAFTREQVRDFVAFAAAHGVEIIPLQHCFGHAEYILQHERYVELREDHANLSQVCPLKHDKARKVFGEIFQDIASLHPSQHIHIGCDETRLLGVCPDCREYVRHHGVSKLFMQYAKLMCDVVLELGKTPVLWADIVLKHPENVREMPREAIFVDWNYGWDITKFGDPRPLVEQGCTFWGAPALRSSPDNFFLTQWEHHLENLRDFIPFGREAGYRGMILTSWSTSGQVDTVREMGEVVEMHVKRHVYPLSGFRMLRQAFADALATEEAIDPQTYVERYARERFGFSEQDGQLFWQALCHNPEFIRFGVGHAGSEVANLKSKAARSVDILHRLAPRQNAAEFEHFRLQLDIRDFYLDTQQALADTNADTFSIDRIPDMRRRVDSLRWRADDLDRRFAELNGTYLKAEEVAEENRVRRRTLARLEQRLSRPL